MATTEVDSCSLLLTSARVHGAHPFFTDQSTDPALLTPRDHANTNNPIPKGYPHSIYLRGYYGHARSEQSEHSPALMTTSYSTRQRARQSGRPGKPIERNRDEVRRARPVLRLERP